MPLFRTAGLVLLAAALAACDGSGNPFGSTPGSGGPPPTPAPDSAVTCTSLGLTAARAAVTVPERGTGASLQAVVFAPTSRTATYPAVSMLPGGSSPTSSVEWSACALAASGYVVVVTRPATGTSTASFHLAAMSGIDYLASAANPFRAATDMEHVGVAGWALGARALTRTQAEDSRVDALVAWDNLAVSDAGDLGSPGCTSQPATVYAPRVPAMGQASDTCPNAGPDAKTTAFRAWRFAGVPSAEIVIGNVDTNFWSASGTDIQHAIAQYYTTAWFDRWLKNNVAGTNRVITRSVGSLNVADVLSTRFFSAVYADGHDCGDLRLGCV